MRPIRVTGVTGTSVPVPLDVYASVGGVIAQVTFVTAGAPALQVTLDNVFDLTITPQWVAADAADATTKFYAIPAGVRAVRGTGMVPADVLVVSQQGIR